ncbi:hypothetical protein TheveDRAFT_1108 [Thermanaerovibrio velox DSM 12556]|uniref:Leucine-binding protein domain-containing protein n=1 Tax=Thermanaerovibrio velox DSM 12556 TaxID=926567 RepID=H0USE3_9BACT|nr:ABC transporter substrate-binding protein [Thermanaerovibrio velox]EHM10232.1 hypothetical protein TheveDRAFT_1108 [Thermanaerovibrio velox DSM 12556]
MLRNFLPSKRFLASLTIALLCLVEPAPFRPNGGWTAQGENLSALKEGWGWPVVVIPPKEGWGSPEGQSLKWALRTAEMEVSKAHSGVHGRDVVFLYPDISDPEDALKRLKIWRSMKVGVIVCFDDGPVMEALVKACRDSGPSLILSDGEDLSLRGPSGKPHPYLFALGFFRNYRANVLSQLMAKRALKGAVISDRYDPAMVQGAQVTLSLLAKRQPGARLFWLMGSGDAGYRYRLAEASAEGANVVVSWLDSMGSISLWKTAYTYRMPLEVWHGAYPDQKLLKEADGLLYVDADHLLSLRQKELQRIRWNIIRTVKRDVTNLVAAAKAYAIGVWVIKAYESTGSADPAKLAASLSSTRDIPLAGEMLAISPITHRPVKRSFGVIRVKGKSTFLEEVAPVSSGSVAEK